MKNLYALATAMIIGLASFAQSDVTFMVDMNNETVSADGVHLAGAFGADGYAEWQPDGIAMSDDDMDGVYEVTLSLAGDYYEFKFINGMTWDDVEDVPNICQVELNGNDNRSINVDGETSYMVCFGRCAACNESSVLFRVDMSLHVQDVEPIDPSGVHVAGSFQGEIWDPGAVEMTDGDEDMVYEALVSFDPSVLGDETLEWKYINGNDWFYTNENVPADCGDGTGNRQVTIEGVNTLTDVYCFNTCGTCVAPTMVTFKVDMSNETVTDGVHLAGAFQGWSNTDTPMSDDDMDGIWEVTLPLAPATYEYKFILGTDGWESVPSGCNTNGNRSITVEGETMEVQYCYNQCEGECTPNPDPAEITFRVNMEEVEVTEEGVWMIAGFTDPQWQGGAIELTDADEDMVYEATVLVSGPAEILYKFVKGDVNNIENEEINIADCGIPNGLDGYNRAHIRTGQPEVLDVVCFDACADCGTNVNDIIAESSFSVYPNPSEGQINFTFDAVEVVNVDLMIVNAMGQIVDSENLGSVIGKVTFNRDLSDLSAGLYTVRIITDKGELNKQIIIR